VKDEIKTRENWKGYKNKIEEKYRKCVVPVVSGKVCTVDIDVCKLFYTNEKLIVQSYSSMSPEIY